MKIPVPNDAQNSAFVSSLSQFLLKGKGSDEIVISPRLLSTYLPYLAGGRFERLTQEPALLNREDKNIVSDVENLAIAHCSVFIRSSQVIRNIRAQMETMASHTDKMCSIITNLDSSLQMFNKSNDELALQEKGLQSLTHCHVQILELLELPQLITTCVRSEAFDEALDLLSYAKVVLGGFEAHSDTNCDNGVVKRLLKQLESEKEHLHNVLLAKLETDVHLPACVKIVGHLRRAGIRSEAQLRVEFLNHRSTFMSRSVQQIESQLRSRPAIALSAAADLLRTRVFDTGMMYKTLFRGIDGWLCAWLSQRVQWFLTLLKLAVVSDDALENTSTGSQHREDILPQKIGRDSVRVDRSTLTPTTIAPIFRQSHHASAILSRLQCDFFALAAPYFDEFIVEYFHRCTRNALTALSLELRRYNWLPCTAFADVTSQTESPALPPAEYPGSRDKGNSLEDFMAGVGLRLTRHRPLAVFINEILIGINEVRQCALASLRSTIVSMLELCMVEALRQFKEAGRLAHVLDADGSRIRPMHRSTSTKVDDPKKRVEVEFFILWQHFAEIGVPLISLAVDRVFGSHEPRLDSKKIFKGVAILPNPGVNTLYE